ncbi:MAG: hypothetical protein IPF78_10325 [Flavobacteriales bacterium]|nr:hypothetical protein [Flavobacteriales bacterium]
MSLRRTLPALRTLSFMLAMAISAIGMSQGRFVINGLTESGRWRAGRLQDGGVPRRGKFKTISADLNKFSLELS